MAEKTYMISWKNMFSALTALLFLLLFLQPSATYAKAQAAAGSYQTVRVGWFQRDMFQEGSSESQPKSGYGYDYLQKMADYELSQGVTYICPAGMTLPEEQLAAI